jgi:glycosyltransferase involved in cell wall biosynthesis
MSSEVVCVIPALNAEHTVEKVVKSVRRSVQGIYVIGIDDGSTDYTRSALQHSCDHTIAFDRNQGKGAALRAGFSMATSNGTQSVLTIDADGQHDAAFAPRLLERLSEVDVVIGARAINALTVPPHRRLANLLSSAATRAVIKCDIRDSQSGFRAIRANVVRSIDARGDRYEFETDFLVRASQAGYTICDVPVPTIYGPPSHFREISDAWRVARVLWNHRSAVFKPAALKS